MSNNRFLKISVAFGLLALVLIFLGVNYVPRIAAETSASDKEKNAAYYAGSDWIERHPIQEANPTYYAGSDWIERHPYVVTRPEYYDNSDWIERHPSNYYSNSDWIERHPGQPNY